MNAPCEDEAEVANEDENASVSMSGQNDRKRKGNDDDPRVEVKNCGALCTSHSKRNGMENMKGEKNANELDGGKNENKEDLSSEREGEVGEDSYSSISTSSSTASGHLNIDTTKVLISKMIIVDKLPLNFVNDEGFRRFMEQAVCASVPEFVIPSLATVTRDILEIYQWEKAYLKTTFVEENTSVSLTVNTWTSDQDMNYMVITGHFSRPGWWKIHRKILNFRQIDDLKGVTIGREVEKCLKQWGIKNIFTLAVDNASSNDTAIAYLVESFKNRLVLDGNFVHVRCCAHVLKLIVCDVMEDFHELISKVRNAVRFVRLSPTRYRSFEKCIEEENLFRKSFVCLDVQTRWDSTYMMLEGAVKFEKAFERLKICDTTYVNEDIPSSRDWEVIRTLVQFLSLFYEARLRLSSSLYTLSNAVFHEISTIQNYIKKHSSNSENLILNDIAKKMQAKYVKYWGNGENTNYLFYVAVVLDPRYKMKFLLYCFIELYGYKAAKEICKQVKDILRQLLEEFSSPIRKFDAFISSMDHHSNTRKCSTNDATEDIVDDEAFPLKEKFGKAVEEDEKATTELDHYLLEPLVCKFKEFDLLRYWQMNFRRFRVLSEIAKEIFAIPVSTIASESAFDVSRRVIDSMYLTLAPNLVEAVACLQNWLNPDAKTIDLQEHIKDVIGMEEDLEKGLKEESIMEEDDYSW